MRTPPRRSSWERVSTWNAPKAYMRRDRCVAHLVPASLAQMIIKSGYATCRRNPFNSKHLSGHVYVRQGSESVHGGAVWPNRPLALPHERAEGAPWHGFSFGSYVSQSALCFSRNLVEDGPNRMQAGERSRQQSNCRSGCWMDI